jgi:C4-dicarboxylate-specific signal transduction histidine kinase
MKKLEPWSGKSACVSICLLLSLVFFALDLSLPLGVAAGVPYVAVVLVALRIRDSRYTYGFAVSSSILTLLGLFLSEELGALWQVVFNRVLALFAIWVTAVLSLQLQNSAERTRQLQKRLASTTRRIEMGELATGIAHELNQPLAAIVNYCEACNRYLDADPVHTEELKECMHKASEQAHRAGMAIKKLRQLVQNDDGSSGPIDCAVIVSGVLRLVETDAENQAVKIVVELADNLPPVIANQAQLEQAIVNIVQNALDAMNESKPGRELAIRVTHDGGSRVDFSIEDSGQGIDTNVAHDLFEPFVSTRTGRVGLGLSVSRSIVLAHGGEIHHQARQPAGSIFRFWIPAA